MPQTSNGKYLSVIKTFCSFAWIPILAEAHKICNSMSCIGSVLTSNNASVLHITSSNIRFVKDELRDFFKKRTSHNMHAVLFSFPLQNAKTFARSLNVLSVINPCRLYLERNVFLNTGDFCMYKGRRILFQMGRKGL